MPESVIEPGYAALGWLQQNVLADLRTLCVGIDTHMASPEANAPPGHPLGGGNFLLVAGCCSAIEYCGQIYLGTANHEKNALAFIRRFLVPLNARYGEVDELFWKCFRHGTVHHSWPKFIEIPGETPIRTGAGNEVGDPHLAPAPEFAGPSLMVNGRLLLADLETALAGDFGRWLLTAEHGLLARRVGPRALRVSGEALLRQAATVRTWYKANGPA